jgi:AraC-like DNA-binding protein
MSLAQSRRRMKTKSRPRHQDSTVDLTPRMVLVVDAASPGAPSLRETARRLAMTPRTLQRRLRAQGISHRELVERLRKQRAIELLTNTALRIEAVAAAIGFSDAAAFHRAFRRWTGVAPGRFRRLTSDEREGERGVRELHADDHGHSERALSEGFGARLHVVNVDEGSMGAARHRAAASIAREHGAPQRRRDALSGAARTDVGGSLRRGHVARDGGVGLSPVVFARRAAR